MQQPDEAIFQALSCQADLIKARELESGSFFGDGPTAAQLQELLQGMEPIIGASTAEPSVLSSIFDAAVKMEMAWLFPDRDVLAGPMILQLQLLQKFTATALETVTPEMKGILEEIVDLSVVERAARRQQALHGNKIIWRLVLARLLDRIGKLLSK